MKKEKTKLANNILKINDFLLSKPIYFAVFGPSLPNYWKDINENRALDPYNVSDVSDVSGIVGDLRHVNMLTIQRILIL